MSINTHTHTIQICKTEELSEGELRISQWSKGQLLTAY